MMKKMMHDRQVLVVLDDVDHIDQLEALASEPNWFKPGSIIIITTRDEQVLIAHWVKLILDVNLLSDKEAICLFSRYAFGRDIPSQGYEELSQQVVCYAAGLPLTIKVLGSFLCGKNEIEWEDALERLKKIPLAETQKKLELSYNSLEDDYKEIFLDVACILKGWKKELAIKALESCGFHARNGFKVLEQRSLITINCDSNDDDDDQWVGMHDHMEEMGRNIVRRSNPDKPHKHSRLWIKDDIEAILANDMGTKATRCIRFCTRKLNVHMVVKGLEKMKKLRFLSVVDETGFFDSDCSIVSHGFPNSLRFLDWEYYPFQSLPETFQADNVVALLMSDSKIVQLWEGGKRKVLNKLRFLDLRCSMLSTLDLGLTPNLETLNLGGCYNVVELHMLVGCSKLISIDASGSRLRTLNFRLALNLETLNLGGCSNLIELHMLVGCSKLISIDVSVSRLRTLNLRLALNLEMLNLGQCCDLIELHMPGKCLSLRSLLLSNSNLRTLDIGLTPNLEYLCIRNCYYLEEVHMADVCEKLSILNLSRSKLKTLDLGLTPNLERLDLIECFNLVELHTSIGCLKKLVHLCLSGCLRFSNFFFHLKGCDSFSVDESLEVGPLAQLHVVANFLECCPLHPANNLPKFRFNYFYEEDRPLLSRNLEMLISVGMCACTNLETFSGSICGLRSLRKLTLEGSILEAPKDLDQLEWLKELILSSTMITHLPGSICLLKHLKSLQLKSCLLLEKLPEDLGRLVCLEKLILINCNFLQSIPNSICRIKCLEEFYIHNCIRVEKLPEELGRLECLKGLDIEGTSISHLPQSILLLKGLVIFGSRHILESCGFTSEIQTSVYCYVVVG